jgi:hypothetical protein
LEWWIGSSAGWRFVYFLDELFFLEEELRFLVELFFRDELFFFEGTFSPASRASESPIAIACLRLFTLPP